MKRCDLYVYVEEVDSGEDFVFIVHAYMLKYRRRGKVCCGGLIHDTSSKEEAMKDHLAAIGIKVAGWLNEPVEIDLYSNQPIESIGDHTLNIKEGHEWSKMKHKIERPFIGELEVDLDGERICSTQLR